MAVNPFVSFVKVRPITSSSVIFTELEKHKFKYQYFRINQIHYLFFYGKREKFDSTDYLYKTITVIEELDTKKRRLRSVRGFVLYAVEILESNNEENIQVLKTNLSSLFWERVKKVMRQNNKVLLFRFLFGASEMSIANEGNSLEQTVQDLQTEVLNLKKKLKEVERIVNGKGDAPKTPINDVSKELHSIY
jgi:hypothetical protein